MPDNQYKEVLIVVIACITLFLILACIILVFIFMHQRRRLQQVREMAALRQQLSEESLQAQLEIQEQTFLAISQEIHDNVGQILSLARVQINIIKEGQQMDRAILKDVRDNIGKAMTDLRDLAKSLNSERISNISIHETLLLEVDRLNRSGIINAEITVEGDLKEIEARKKLILFRILQESLQNCIKHAEASRVSIRCLYGAEEIEVCIRDNGKGFDLESAVRAGGGQGLGNIRTRVRLTGGQYKIESGRDQGTKINITIPYE